MVLYRQDPAKIVSEVNREGHCTLLSSNKEGGVWLGLSQKISRRLEGPFLFVFFFYLRCCSVICGAYEGGVEVWKVPQGRSSLCSIFSPWDGLY